MKIVKSVPDPEPRKVVRDAWLDALLDGKLRLLSFDDWSGRYGTKRSAQSAICQAAASRGLGIMVAMRGDDLYVQSSVPEESNGTEPTKAKRKPAAVAAK